MPERTGAGRSLVALRLETGRTHQIRVHMAFLGCPLAGDFLYGTELEALPPAVCPPLGLLRLRQPVTGGGDCPVVPSAGGTVCAAHCKVTGETEMVNTLSFLPIPCSNGMGNMPGTCPGGGSPPPYRGWVSEIMRQQTRVAAVLGYFAKFMDAFPTVQDLAAAPEDQLMKLWGLGYYSRARNLQKAARQIVDTFWRGISTDYGGHPFPGRVGDHTAAAIASISFGQPVPAVDAICCGWPPG